MKTLKYFTVLSLLFFACNSSEDTQEETAEPEITQSATDSSTFNPELNSMLWNYEFDTTTRKFKLIRNDQLSDRPLSIETVTALINQSWPQIQVKFIRTSMDTVFIKIPKSEYLVNEIGSSGANEFIATTTFSYTEVRGVKYVAMDFIPGDHAEPGVYSRGMWKH